MLQKIKTISGRFLRRQFLKTLPKDSVGIELGVFKGEFTKHILQVVQPRKLHLVDVWWTLFGENYPNWGEYTDFGRLKTRVAFESARQVVNQFDSKKGCIFYVGDDLEYLKTIDDGYFDWAYLDTTHFYEHTRSELQLLKNKVKFNGLICGHDWYPDSTNSHHGVYKAVNEFCLENNWEVIKVDRVTQWCIRRKQ